MLKVQYSGQFKKDFKRIKKRGLDLARLRFVIDELANGNTLAPAYKDHCLTGDYASFRECHIQPDWLLIYRVDKDKLVLVAQRTGSHSDLFK